MKKIIILFLVWRFFLFGVAAISPTIISPFGAKFPYASELKNTQLPHFLWSWGNFDGVYYLRIAKSAYADQYSQAFFPAYSLLVKLISPLVFGNLLISALLISNISFLISLIIFNNLIIKVYDPKIAFWSTLFLLSFPTSFFFGAVYTEGLFFLLIVSVFYLAQEGKIWQASILGCFASLTRLVGVFLAPSLIFKKEIKKLLPLFFIPIGIISYMIFLQIKFNNPLYFLTSQTVFGQQRLSGGVILLPQVFFRYLKIITTVGGLPKVNATFEFILTVWALVAIIMAYFKKVKIEWLIFSFLVVITPTLTGTLASMPRYMLIAFPIYLIPAFIKSFKIKLILIGTSSLILTVATVFFAQGYWVA